MIAWELYSAKSKITQRDFLEAVSRRRSKANTDTAAACDLEGAWLDWNS